jgi:integrase
MTFTGLRIIETLTLEAAEVALDTGVLTIRLTKIHRSRPAPLHTSALEPLRVYAATRDRRRRTPRDTTIFVSDAGRRLPYGTVRHTSHQLQLKAITKAAPTGRARPRLHDLRYTFACRRLMAWSRDGTDIDRSIDQLSSYLGHA